MNDFDKWLREEMEKRNYSARAMAKKTGLTYQTILFLMRGERQPSLYTFSRILTAFDLHMEIVQN